MKFQQLMGVEKRSCFCFCFVVLVILICASIATSLNDQETEELFLAQLADPVTGDVNTEMAELLWVKCNLDLFQLKEAVDGFDLCPKESLRSSKGINSECQMLTKEKMNRMLSVMHPQVKHNLLGCLRNNFHISGEDCDSKVWYSKYLESFFFMPKNLRRNLGSRWLQSTTEVPAQAPTAEGPVSGPAISPAPAPAPSSFQAPVSPPPTVPPRTPFFPPDSVNPGLQPSADENSSNKASGTNGQTEKKNGNHRSVIIAVVVTAFVTFVIVALLFFCYYKRSKARQTDENHERPLLSLSLSENTVGSSPKFSAFGNYTKEDKLTNQMSNLSHHKTTSSLDGNSHVVSDDMHTSVHGAAGINKTSTGSSYMPGSTNGSVPPPGAVPITTNTLPPLRPPPGRAEPLPPEPRSSFKPPSSNTNPPLPPPPVPPSSSRPPGNSGRPPGPPPPPPPVPTINQAGPRPPPPPVPTMNKAGPRPPPPPKSGVPPPRPPQLAPKGANPPRPPKHLSTTAPGEGGSMEDTDAPKAKLKPFFWDKVLANPDTSMVWHQIKSGSFQFNEEMIETLFGYAAPVDRNKNEGKKESSSQDPPHQYIQIIDSKKAQNLSILLRALNVTKEEVCDAIHEGNELPPELIENLLKMAPTQEEELKLRLFNGELSQLGPAERFLKSLVAMPFAFKRLESLHFMCTLQEDITNTKESFVNLEVACKELKSNRLFLKLLEAVLKTGNRMNDGTFRGGAQAFKLDTLLKLSDVKGKDGKTTLLQFVVQEIIRTEGIRAARTETGSKSFSSTKSKALQEETSSDTDEHYHDLGLQVVSGLSNELQNVKKAAAIDADSLTGTVAKLGHALLKTRDFLNKDMQSLEEESPFHLTLKSFVQNAEVDIMSLLEEEKRIMQLVKATGDYFHGNAGKDEGLRLFVIVRDFLIMIDKTCREVAEAQKKRMKGHRKAASSSDANNPSSNPISSDLRRPPSPDLHELIFPAISDRRMDHSSSDDESP